MELLPDLMDISDQPMQQDQVETLISIPINVHARGEILTERAVNRSRKTAGEVQKRSIGGRTWKRNKGKENAGIDTEGNLVRRT